MVYASAAPALSKAKEAAIKNGTPYGITISTTPNDRDSYEGAYAYSILESAVQFDDSWYDMTVPQIQELIKKSSKNNFVYIKYHYWQLGRDEEWFEEQKRNLNNDLLKIKRELLLEWTLANDKSPFSEKQLDDIAGYIKKEPISFMYIKNYKFKVYEEMTNLFRKNWLISIDIGGGLQQDFTVIAITDPMTKKMKAIFRSNNITGPELEGLVEEMVSTFFPNGVIIPERNSLGVPILQSMCNNPRIRPRLYYEIKERTAERVVEDPRVNQVIKKKKSVQSYGQYTSGTSRNVMFNEILSYMVDNEPENIIVPELYDELRGLERSTRGKIEARVGSHDDVVMAWLIGLYALLYGKNISKFVSLVGDFSETPNGSVPMVDKSKTYSKNVRQMFIQKQMSPEMIEFMNNCRVEEEKPSKSNKVKRNISFLLGK